MAAAALVVLLALSGVLHEAPARLSASEARNILVTVVLHVLYLVAVAAARPSFSAAVKTLGLSAALASVYSITTGVEVSGRLIVDSLNPNSAGHAAAIGVVALLAAFQITRRTVYLLLSVPPLYVVFLAQSRGGLTVLAAGLAVLWIASRKGRSRAFAVIALAVFMIVLWGNGLQQVQQWFLSSRDSRNVESESRIELARLALRLMREHPFGIGNARFSDYSTSVVGIPLNTHDDWLRIGVEVGVVALLLLLYVTLSRFRALPAGGRAVLAAAATSMAFANVAVDARVSLPLWLVAGLAWDASGPGVGDSVAAGLVERRPADHR
jgi:hypothetical protein